MSRSQSTNMSRLGERIGLAPVCNYSPMTKNRRYGSKTTSKLKAQPCRERNQMTQPTAGVRQLYVLLLSTELTFSRVCLHNQIIGCSGLSSEEANMFGTRQSPFEF